MRIKKISRSQTQVVSSYRHQTESQAQYAARTSHDSCFTVLHSANQTKLRHASYHSVQNLLPSLLPKNTNIKICRIIILPVVSDECETRSLTLREEHRLRAIGNTALRNIVGSARVEITGLRRDCIMRSCMIGTAH